MANQYDTQDLPVGTTDVKAMSNNASNFDEFSVGTSPSFTDRKNKRRKTIAGMEKDYADLLQRSGFETVHLQYVNGSPLVVSRATQLIDRAPSVYRVKTPATFPVNLTGNWATDQNLLVDVGDQGLRASLAAPDGASLIGGADRYAIDLATMKLAAGRYNGDAIRTLSYAAARPGIGGAKYIWSSTSVATANDATIVQVTGVATGRWLIDLSGPLLASQVGCVSDYSGNTGTDNRVRLQVGMDAWPHFKIDGKYGTTFDTANIGAGIIIRNDNVCLEFAKNSRISALAHNDPIYQFVRVWDRNNVKVIGGNFDGRKDLNAASTGEFGMGVDVRGGSEILIEDLKTINMWGDGFYVGQSASGNTVNGLTLNDHVARYCRRQGMSITSGINVVVNDPLWTDIAGTAPAAGLDIEPDNNTEFLIGIRINNPRTARCVSGIAIFLNSFVTGGTTGKDVDIVITGHVDIGSKIAFNAAGCTTLNNTVKVKGSVKYIDGTSINAGGAAMVANEWDLNGPTVYVTRPVVIDSNRDGQSSPVYGSPFVCYRDTGSANTYPIGNFVVEEATVVLRSGSIPALYCFGDVTQTLPNVNNVQNCHFLDPLKLDGLSGNQVRGLFKGFGSFRDGRGQWTYPLTGSSTLDVNYGAPLLFPSVSSNITIPTGYCRGGMPDLVIKTSGNQSYDVILPAAGAIIGLPSVTRLRSVGGNGSYIRLRPVNTDQFLLIERVGLWTDV